MLLESANFNFINPEEYSDDEEVLSSYNKKVSDEEKRLTDYLKSTQTKEGERVIDTLSPVELEQLKDEIAEFKFAARKSETALRELKGKFVLKNKDYISEMARYLITNKYASAEDFIVALPDPESVLGDTYNDEGIKESIKAALTLNIIKKDDIFGGYRLGLSSDVELGLAIRDKADNLISVKLPIIDMFSIKKFAELDMDYIEFYER